MTRGFVTLATGNIKYYKMALNMLRSFKLHNPDAKMAIVCDKRNEIAEQFDDVVILEKANGNYRDKFSLLVNAPYDETIFIEPDCLIYRNLDFFWDLLAGESDFSCFGWNNGGIDCWFKSDEEKQKLFELVPDLKEIGDAPLFNPGYFYIRKGDGCQKMYEDCLAVAEKLSADETLKKYPYIWAGNNLRDDPIFDIAMALNGFICNSKPKYGKCIFLPSKYKINKISAVKGVLDVTDKNGKKFTECALLHFSSRKAFEEGLYLWQTMIFNMAYDGKKTYRLLDNKIFYGICAAYRFVKTKLCRIFKK